jgi:hypothetical protein
VGPLTFKREELSCLMFVSRLIATSLVASLSELVRSSVVVVGFRVSRPSRRRQFVADDVAPVSVVEGLERSRDGQSTNGLVVAGLCSFSA